MPRNHDPKRAHSIITGELNAKRDERRKAGRRTLGELVQDARENRPEFQTGQVMRLDEYYAHVLKTKKLDLRSLTFPRFVQAYNRFRRWGTPRFHNEIAEWLQATAGSERRILMAYRERGKSHLACLYGLYCLLMDPDDSIMIVRATAGIAERNSLFFKRTMETFPLVMHLKPPKPWPPSTPNAAAPRSW